MATQKKFSPDSVNPRPIDSRTRSDKGAEGVRRRDGHTTSSVLVRREPIKMTGSHRDRENRAQQLASLFIGEMIPLLVQVRQDFLDKTKDEMICGVKTFEAYCTAVLRYSAVHIRRLIKGQNPASAKHDGSVNRVYEARTPNKEPDAHPSENVQKFSKIKPIREPIHVARVPIEIPEIKLSADFQKSLAAAFSPKTCVSVTATIANGWTNLSINYLNDVEVKKLFVLLGAKC